MKRNKYKGFTLIELLAVIVILAIIALIATPIVLDIIDDSKKSSIVRSADFYLDGVEFSIANAVLDSITIKDGVYYIIEEGNICLEEYDASTKTCKDSNSDEKIEILEVEVNGEVPEVGSTIEIKSGNIGKISLNYDGQKVSKKADGSLALGGACTVVSGDGTKVGDEIECAGEYFYVISNDGTNINMLSKYNLDVGSYYDTETSTYVAIENPTGIQNEKARGVLANSSGTDIDYDNLYGVIAFASSNYWYDYENSVLKEAYGTEYPVWVYNDLEGNVDETNLIYSHVENYVNYLKKEGLSEVTGRLISYEELVSLGCDVETNVCSAEVMGEATNGTAPEWVYSTTYWSGSANGDFSVWEVDSIGTFDFISYGSSNSGSLGVRPVITISSSDI